MLRRHNQPLVELQSKLRSLPQYLGPAVTEAWLRRYQVRFSEKIRACSISVLLITGLARTHPSDDGNFRLRRISSACDKSVRHGFRSFVSVVNSRSPDLTILARPPCCQFVHAARREPARMILGLHLRVYQYHENITTVYCVHLERRYVTFRRISEILNELQLYRRPCKQSATNSSSRTCSKTVAQRP